MPDVFQGPFEPFNHCKKRLTSKSKPEFWEMDFSIFMEEFQDVWAPLVNSYEVFSSNCYFVLIVRTHFVRHFWLNKCDSGATLPWSRLPPITFIPLSTMVSTAGYVRTFFRHSYHSA